jgi:hypothetical protein
LASQTLTLQPSIIHFKLQLLINEFFQSIRLASLEGNKGRSGGVFSTHSMRLSALSDKNACNGAKVGR